MKHIKSIIAVLLVGMVWVGCSDDNLNGSMSVHMTDAPGLYHQVNVEIVGMSAHYAESNSNDTGWVDLNVNAGVYNLLEFQNGLDTALVDKNDVPVGKVNQLRLMLGTDNSVMMLDSSIVSLSLSSQEQTGLKMQVNAEVDPGTTTKIIFDFDAETSVIVQGNGKLRLKPVLKVLQVE